MKPKPINIKPVGEDTLQFKKMSIETPLGTIESDSGNHYLDVASVIFVIAVLYIGKKLIDKKIKDFRL
tara:strand:+ start:997 stop:1200 length:204 start_codon:yes stop_codon:yes gene_type:complete